MENPVKHFNWLLKWASRSPSNIRGSINYQPKIKVRNYKKNGNTAYAIRTQGQLSLKWRKCCEKGLRVIITAQCYELYSWLLWCGMLLACHFTLPRNNWKLLFLLDENMSWIREVTSAHGKTKFFSL